MGSMNVIIRLIVLSSFLCQYGVESGRSLFDEQDMELERQLSILSKPAIKTIQVKGDLYDCVDIYKQPAFDHPLLKNHKVQMRPTSQPKQLSNRSTLEDKSREAKLMSINCPQGTVPIRRILKEDLIRAKNFSRTHITNIHPQTAKNPGQHVVSVTPTAITTYYGVSARLNVYGLHLHKDQQSTVQMWIENGPLENFASIQAGIMVSPPVTGNSDIRLFVFWTADSIRTGCYNFHCPGYVQVGHVSAPGSRVVPESTYGANDQYIIDVAIFKDKTTGDWWFKVGGKDLGYWPKAILPQLNKGASMVAWGGMATGPPNGDSPPMGNGHFPNADFRKACFIEQLQTIDAANNYIVPDEHGMKRLVDNPKCYGLEYWGKQKTWGLSLLLGGPGGKCGM